MTDRMTISDQQLRAMQVIALALPMGVVMFALVTVFVIGVLQHPGESQVVSLLAAGFAVLMFLMHLIVPNTIARAAVSQGRAASLPGIYQTKLIVGLALLEGAAFFNLVASIVEKQWWSLAVAGGLVLWMLTLFPTRTRVEHWIESQQMMNS